MGCPTLNHSIHNLRKQPNRQDLRSRHSQGGLEGCKPSKIPSFLFVVGGFAANYEQKKEISGRRSLPEPYHRVSPVIERKD